MKKLSQEVMKKARAENVTLKRELHGLLKVQGSVLPTIIKKLRGKKQLLPFYLHIRNCPLTL